MSRRIQVQVALVALLVAAGIVGQQTYSFRPVPFWYFFGLLCFGIVNVVFTPPGTQRVRAAASARRSRRCCGPRSSAGVVFLAWLVWPPAFMVAWALARESKQNRGRTARGRRSRHSSADRTCRAHRSGRGGLARLSIDRRPEAPADRGTLRRDSRASGDRGGLCGLATVRHRGCLQSRDGGLARIAALPGGRHCSAWPCRRRSSTRSPSGSPPSWTRPIDGTRSL